VTRAQLEHVIRAAARIADSREIIVIGSQAVLGQFPDAPPELLRSMEADLYPREQPELADLIDAAIGELSQFHETFGYHAHGVGPEAPTLPSGWMDRLVRIPTEVAVGLCLDVHDLVLSKYAASREKDREFVRVAIRHGIVDQAVLLERLGTMPLDGQRRRALRALIAADIAEK
jgi:hypothetical protein